jgi:RimJ/RimL family protein N-acetyltransferase
VRPTRGKAVLPPIERPLTDAEVSVRRFDPVDAEALISGRDAESNRFLGEGSSDPRPAGCIWVGASIVGWIDYDRDDREWLAADEVNVGYNIFPLYRGQGYGTRALRLLRQFLSNLEPPYVATVLIHPANLASISLATRAGFIEVPRVDGQVFMK